MAKGLVSCDEFEWLVAEVAMTLVRDPEVAVGDLAVARAAVLGAMQDSVRESARQVVMEACGRGLTWQEIGDAFGIARSGAHTRFSVEGIEAKRRRQRASGLAGQRSFVRGHGILPVGGQESSPLVDSRGPQ